MILRTCVETLMHYMYINVRRTEGLSELIENEPPWLSILAPFLRIYV